MKTRNGFVSNSSSSSFILHGMTCKQIAEKMMEVVQEDWDSYDAGSGGNKKMFSEWFRKLSTAEDNENITLPSTNYETYIRQMDDGSVYVTTCNNHQWPFISYDMGGADMDEAHTPNIEGQLFFDVRDGSMHSTEKYVDVDVNEVCSECKEPLFSIYYTARGTAKCTRCLAEDITVMSKGV